MKSECKLCKGNPDFILVIDNNNTSIMHRFRYNQVLPLSGTDVKEISLLGGAEGKSLMWILEGRPRLYICFFIASTRLSCTVSDLIKFFRQPEMTALYNLRKGALQLNYVCGFWESENNFILVFNSNHTSIMHVFDIIKCYRLPEMTSKCFSARGCRKWFFTTGSERATLTSYSCCFDILCIS